MSTSNLRVEYRRLRDLEDSGERGARTHQEYVAAARAYAEELALEMTEVSHGQASEHLEAALAGVEAARSPEHKDDAISKLRVSIDEAEALRGTR
ncbi:MAG: hypothetical protein ACRENL_00475 [Candidatus Dormibacteria bacterium]